MKKWIAFFAVLACLAVPATLFAQEAQPAPPEMEPAEPEAAQAEQPDLEQVRREQRPMLRLFSELAGSDITSEGEGLTGSIEDLVLTPDGQITHLLIEASQLTGVGEQEAQGDLGAVRQIGESGRYFVPIEMASFAEDWDEPVSLDLGEEGLQGLTEQEGDRIPADLAPGTEEQRLELASRLMDFELTDNAGEALGGVEELMLDLEQSRVVYFALSPAGELGAGGRQVALAPDKITGWDDENQRVETDLSRAELEQVQGFEGGNYPLEAEL